MRSGTVQLSCLNRALSLSLSAPTSRSLHSRLADRAAVRRAFALLARPPMQQQEQSHDMCAKFASLSNACAASFLLGSKSQTTCARQAQTHSAAGLRQAHFNTPRSQPACWLSACARFEKVSDASSRTAGRSAQNKQTSPRTHKRRLASAQASRLRAFVLVEEGCRPDRSLLTRVARELVVPHACLLEGFLFVRPAACCSRGAEQTDPHTQASKQANSRLQPPIRFEPIRAEPGVKWILPTCSRQTSRTCRVLFAQRVLLFRTTNIQGG